MGAIPSGKGGERFPHPKGRIWRDLGGGAAGGDHLLLFWSGRSEGKKGRVGEKRPARSLDNGLVAPARMARQGGPHHHRPSICHASGVGATSPLCRAIVCPRPVSTEFCTWCRGRLFWSRHSQWRDRVVLSHHLNWRDKHRILLLCPASAAAPCFWCSLAAACFCCWCSSC